MPLFGPPDIKKLAEKRDLDGLIRALSHKEWSIRQHAAQALGGLADFLGFANSGRRHDPSEWPEPWPWPEGRRYPLEPVRSSDMLPGEVIIGVLPVHLQATITRGPTYAKYTVHGRHAVQIASALGGFTMNPRGVVYRPLLLCITTQRVVVTEEERGRVLWESNISRLEDVAVPEKNILEGGHGPSGLLWLDFGDSPGSAAGAVAAFGRLQNAQALGDEQALREALAAVAAGSKELLPLVSVVIEGWGSEEVGKWAGECRRYLRLVHARDLARLELYVRAAVAESRGAYEAVEALAGALADKEKPVQSAAAEALERIDGPEAQRALAKYREPQLL